jgi:LacI family transcriptional regulator
MKSKKRKRVTLQEVANHAGVSRTTASLSINNNPSIPEATREKVLESMRQLGYVYDRVAANLRSQQSSTIGLIIDEMANPFFSELQDGVHNEMDKAEYTVLSGTTYDSYDKLERILSTMVENRVGGVIFSPVTSSSNKTIDQIYHWDIPIVVVNKYLSGSNYDYVGVDNVVGAQKAVDYLIREGHRRIAFLGGFLESTPWKDRKQGYSKAFHQAGLEIDDSLIINSPTTREGGFDAIRQLIHFQNLPTAIFCYNDVVAIGVMEELKKSGIIPGKDIAIVGFDNIKEAAIVTPGLTTVNSYIRNIGTHAARLLLQRIMGFEGDPQRIILEPELIIRDSCSYTP